MPVRSSGPISLLDLVGEFGGGVPHSLSEYYKNGGRVPNVGPNAAIPFPGGAISLSNFYGATFMLGFNIYLLAAGGTGSVNVTSTPDPRRNFIVVQVYASGNTGLQPPIAATIAGVQGSTLLATNSTVRDDGHGVTVTSRQVPTGDVVNISFPSGGGVYAVFVTYGMTNVANAITAVVTRRNTDGGDRNLIGGPNIAISTSAANSVVLYVAMLNGNGGIGGDPTGRLDIVTAPASVMGFDLNPIEGSTPYNYNLGGAVGLVAAIAFNKNSG